MDGRDPAPWDRRKPLSNGINQLLTGAGFLLSAVSPVLIMIKPGLAPGAAGIATTPGIEFILKITIHDIHVSYKPFRNGRFDVGPPTFSNSSHEVSWAVPASLS